jgi:hypothetical protein
MPAPHWPDPRQEHSPLSGSFAGQTGRGELAEFAGNAVALDCSRATSWAGVKFALTARISAAMPETIGVAKLVPRFAFCSFV